MPGAHLVPLLLRPPGDAMAVVDGRTITAGEFLGQVNALAHRLPSAGHLFNLVQDRYAFTVAFAAVLAAGRCNLLPPNPKPDVQARLAESLDTVAVIHDGLAVTPGLAALDLGPAAELPGSDVRTVPEIPGGHIAAISFTSGSTGQAQPIAKTLGMFRGAVALYEGPLVPRGSRVVATVPAQHMYGLELASLQALWSPVLFTPGKPLFPLDVQAELAAVDGPRVLVTTPLHLRALLESGLAFPALERVLSATAPLDAALAQRAEVALGARVIDVYGCSEAGCMATREVARETRWRPLPGVRFQPGGEDATVVHAAHLDQPVPLADQLEFTAPDRFRITGRLGDMINVAGKRGSLGDITRRLLDVPGVDDAVAFAPPSNSDNRRPAAVYAGSADRAAIRAHLSRFLDDVFLPRPLIQVDRLPRTDTSKLPRKELLALYRQHQRRP